MNLKANHNFRFIDFRQWFTQKTGLPFNLNLIDPKEISPGQPTKFPYFQSLSVEITRARNAHLLRLIAQELNQLNRVLVVYGAGHHVELKRALNTWFKNQVVEKVF